MKDKQIRASHEFIDLLEDIRAICWSKQRKRICYPEITKKIAKHIDKEKLWENEFV